MKSNLANIRQRYLSAVAALSSIITVIYQQRSSSNQVFFFQQCQKFKTFFNSRLSAVSLGFSTAVAAVYQQFSWLTGTRASTPNLVLSKRLRRWRVVGAGPEGWREKIHATFFDGVPGKGWMHVQIRL